MQFLRVFVFKGLTCGDFFVKFVGGVAGSQ